MSRLVHAKNIDNWPFLRETVENYEAEKRKWEERFKKQPQGMLEKPERLRKFKYIHGILYGTTNHNKLIAYGSNQLGILGVCDISPATRLVEIEELANKEVVDIVPGLCHIMILTRDGQLWGWGDNRFGQIGTGEAWKNWNYVPHLIFEKDIISVKCGFWHTLALDRFGKVFAWGCNDHRQVNGEEIREQMLPVKLCFDHCLIADISCNSFGSLALSTMGTVFWWGGSNPNGPTLMRSPEKFKGIVAGRSTYVLLTVDSEIYIMVCQSKALLKVENNIVFDKIYYASDEAYFGITKADEVYHWPEEAYAELPIAPEPREEDWRNPKLVELKFVMTGTSLADAFLTYGSDLFPQIMFEWRDIDPDSFNSPTNSNFTIAADDGQIIHTQRSLLCGMSDHMMTLLSEQWLSSENELRVSSAQFHLYYLYLKYLYTGRLDVDTYEDAVDLLMLVSSFFDYETMDACFDLIFRRFLDKETCIELHNMLDAHFLVDYASKVKLFMLPNFNPEPN